MFKGKIGKEINEDSTNFMDACDDFIANEYQPLKYLYNLLDDEAKRLYRNFVHSRSTLFCTPVTFFVRNIVQ